MTITAAAIAALIQPDKALHALFGALASMAGLIGGHIAGWLPLAAAAIACAVVAVGREVYNRCTGGRFDLRDVVWTLAGGAVVLAAAWLGA